MSESILRLNASMMISHVAAKTEIAKDRVMPIIGDTTPSVADVLEHTPLRFSLMAPVTRKIHVAA